MIKFLAIAAVASIGLQAMGQSGFGGGGFGAPSQDSDGKVVRRLKIQHADPALILRMLAGNQSTGFGPEMSTILNMPGNGGFGGSNFGGGNGNRTNGNGSNSNSGSRSPGGSSGPGGNRRSGGGGGF